MGEISTLNYNLICLDVDEGVACVHENRQHFDKQKFPYFKC